MRLGAASSRAANCVADYQITFARSAAKELEALPAAIVGRIFPKIEALTSDPRPRRSKKLRGELALWRIRIGDYRVIYSIDDSEHVVDITAIRHRSKAYE